MIDNNNVILREPLDKLSKLQIKCNKRLVELRNDMICYYSEIPKNFDQQTDLTGKIPKVGILLSDILEIQTNIPNVHKKY